MADAPALTEHPEGNYLFLPGIAPYSRGVVASPGYEIFHLTFQNPLPYREGFDWIAGLLAEEGRPKSALCALELRSPRPFTYEGFAEFNAGYAEILKEWGVFVDGVNPVARTNIAPEVVAPGEPVLYAFSYTRPATANWVSPTFVVAGAGELPEGVLSPDAVIAPGDNSVEGIQAKAAFVMALMHERLTGLGASWAEVTAIDVYSVNPIYRAMIEVMLPRFGLAGLHGIHWYYSRPPIAGLEFEMDLRGVRTELRVE